METLRELLMTAPEAELSRLAEYLRAGDLTSLCQPPAKPGASDASQKYQQVNALLAAIQGLGRIFFYSKLEYPELVRRVAESLDAGEESTAATFTAQQELTVVTAFLLKYFPFMPPSEQQALFQEVGLAYSGPGAESANRLTALLRSDLADVSAYKLTRWLAGAVYPCFRGDCPHWDQPGLPFSGRSEFRKFVIYPLLHIASLRQQYRQQQRPQCPACQTPLLVGGKFCSECGFKLV